jgi:glycosyltransferase involved in cell wall biosynthesis
MHSFNPFLATSAVASGRPIVYTEHGNFAFGRKIGMTDILKSKLLKLFLNSYVDYITFNSEFTQKISENRYGLGNVPRSVIYNGVDIDGITRPPNQIENTIARLLSGKFVVGTSSRFVGFKRIDRLIDAFAEFQHDKPDTMLLLVGEGVLRSELERRVRNLKISEKIIFAGYRSNVFDYQRKMDVCVFPSETEPFGIAAVETLLLGKPTLISADGGGLVEVVGGFSHDDVANDVRAMADRLNYYYCHRDQIDGRAGERMKYASKFNIEDTADQFLRIYQKTSSG